MLSCFPSFVASALVVFIALVVLCLARPAAAGGVPDARTQTPLFPLRAAGTATYYVMLGSDFPLSFTPTINAEGAALMSNLRKSAAFGLLAGIVLSLCVYNFLIFLSLRDYSYLWFVLIHSGILALLASGQWTPLFIDPCQSVVAMMIINLCAVGWCLFTQNFMDTKRYVPRGHKVLTLFACLAVALACIGPFLSRTLFLMLDSVLALCVMLFSYALSLVLSFRGVPAARLVCAVWSLTLGLFLFAGLGDSGPFNLGLADSLVLAVQAMLMSVALAWRTRVLREEMVSARAAMEVKSVFLATMSHEIRTPMAAIMGYAGLLQGLDLPAQGRRYLRNVQAASEHLLGIMNDILDMAKLDAGRISLEEQDFSLEQMVEDVVRLCAPMASENRNELICVVDGKIPPMLFGDPLRVRQVLMNLASNALKFTKQGEVRIAVDADGVAGPDEVTARDIVVRMTVSDTGIGISPDQQERLFQPFAQADESMARTFGGTGLGLHISRSLTRMMHGELSVVSAPGAGAVFTATLMLGVASTQPERVCPRMPAAAGQALIVDDNASARQALADLAQEFGITAKTVGWVGEAKEVVRGATCPYGLVFVDLEMPEMDGLEAARQLREAGLNSGVPIILLDLLGYGDADVGEFDRAGIRSVLSKPASRRSFCAAVHEAFTTHVTGVQVAAAGSDPDVEACRGRRVLVVDDNEFNLDVLETILSMAGLEVVTAASGADALDILASGPSCDAVLMDVQMPGMDGYEAARRIRANPLWKGLPVLAITANFVKGERERCIEAGMDDFLTKPVDQAALFSALAHLFRGAEGSRS